MKLLASLAFGPYTPDQPDLGHPGLERARNVLPRIRGYDSLPMISAYGSDRLVERCVGAFSAKDTAGLSYVYAGTVGAKLWRLDAVTWVDASRVAPTYSPATRWEFSQFGNTTLAAHLDDQIQAVDLGSPNFADLTTSNVQGATITTMRGFVVVGDVKDDDGYSPWRVRWGPLNNPAGDWTPSPTTLADFNDLRTVGGKVQRVIGGEFGLVFRERSTWRMTFAGSPIVWQFDEVDPGIGALAPGSVVRHGARTFFFSEDGVRMTVGDASQPIGEEQIDRTLLGDLDGAHLDRVTGAAYTDEQIIIWAYPGPGNTGGRSNRLLIYNYGTNRWAHGDEAVEILFQASVPARSIDGFDDNATYGGTQSPTLYASVDDIPGSLDDHTWNGGTFELGVIDADRDLAFYTGAPRDAQFETSEQQFIPGRRALVTEMRSLANAAASVNVEVGHRSSQRDSVLWESAVEPTNEGFIPARVDDRYMRFRVNVTGGFDDSVGLEVYGEPSGGR